LLIVAGDSEDEVATRLDDDPSMKFSMAAGLVTAAADTAMSRIPVMREQKTGAPVPA